MVPFRHPFHPCSLKNICHPCSLKLEKSFRQLEAVVENAPHMTVAVETGGAVRDEEGTMLQEATVEDVVVGFGKAGAANANDIETGTVAESAGPDDLNAGRQ